MEQAIFVKLLMDSFLSFKPGEEVIHTGTADSHLERRFRVGEDAKSSSGLFYYACDGLQRDDAAAGYTEELAGIQFFVDNIK